MKTEKIIKREDIDLSTNSHPTYSIRAKELYSLINKVTDVPPEQVQDVFQAFGILAEYCMSQGIDFKMPYLGTFRTTIKRGKRKGETYRIPKGASYWLYTKEGAKLIKAEENIIRVCEEDKPDYLMPQFKFLPSFRKRIREQTEK